MLLLCLDERKAEAACSIAKSFMVLSGGSVVFVVFVVRDCLVNKPAKVKEATMDHSERLEDSRLVSFVDDL